MKNVGLFLLLSFITSCSSLYYAPNSQNVPMFTEQGQGEFGLGQGYILSIDNGDFAQVLEIQGAYSFFDHWAAQVNYMTLFGGGVKYNYLEGSYGYFLPLEHNFVFEVYPGIGFGNVENSFSLKDLSNLTSNASFTKLFVQPSIGYTINRFEIAFSTRFTYLNYYKITADAPPTKYKELNLDVLGGEHYNFEPALSFGFRFDYLKLEMQWYGTTSIGANHLPSYDRGAIISLSYLLKKRK